MKDTSVEKEQRTVYFDYLRVFAIISVIVLHVSAQNWYNTDVNGYEWQVFNFFNSIVRWGVPVFVMISGALFLNKEIETKRIYCKYVPRLVISFFFWSFIYVVFGQVSRESWITSFVYGQYHMWFVIMITGLYMCIPIIKCITKSEKTTKYYLLLSFLFAFLLPQTITLLNDFGTEKLKTVWLPIIQSHLSTMGMNVVLGYASCFVLGYFINKATISKKIRIIIYILGVIGFVSTIWLTLRVSLIKQTATDNYYQNFTVNVLFEAMAVFTWFKYKRFNLRRLNLVFKELSRYSYGAYLVHILVLDQLLTKKGISTMSYNAVVSVIIISAIVLVISYAISAVLNNIPIIKKYIV